MNQQETLMQQTHFEGMEPVPPSKTTIAFLETYMTDLGDYLEEVAFCKNNCSSELVAVCVAAKGVPCFISEKDDYGDTRVVIPNVRLFDIHIVGEIYAIYRGGTGEIVYTPNFTWLSIED